MYVKQTKFGILVHVAVKMGNIQQVLWMTHKVTCHEVIDVDVEAKSKDKAKTIRPNFNIKKTTCKAQNIDSHQHLLLLDKKSSKKPFITILIHR